MANACLSFDIGTRNIHAVLGQAEGSHVKILKSTVKPLPKGVISDGLVSNMEMLVMAVQDATAELGNSARDAVITFNSNSVIIREFEVPSGTDQEVEAMIKNEIAQYFGMTETDLVEYRKIAQSEKDNVKKINVRAAVMNSEIAHGYYDLLNNLNLRPIALDIQPNVISKIFSGQPVINGNSGESYILLDIGYSGTMIYIIAKEGLSFFRFVNFGGKAIDRLMSKAFSLTDKQTEAKKIELLSEYKPMVTNEADNKEKISTRSLRVKKKGYYFITKKNDTHEEVQMPEEGPIEDMSTTPSDKVLTKEEALDAVKPLYGELMEDLRKVLQFFANRSGAQKVDQIYLMGEGAYLSGLTEYLSQGMGINVSKLQSISTIHFNYNEQFPGSFINAAGALIRL